jgi:DNA-binding NarL/FixJ family response regulator
MRLLERDSALDAAAGRRLVGRAAQAELRVSDESARRRDPSPSQQRTHQEGQVARLAGQGLTNQQFAERLFVSRHTVGDHLHKLYAKLGIASRAELGKLDLDDGDRR